jgi:uncharacterized RDD family membrane protein YckC
VPNGLELASFRRRFAAGAIDAAILMVGLGAAGVVTFRRFTGKAERRAQSEREAESGRRAQGEGEDQPESKAQSDREDQPERKAQSHREDQPERKAQSDREDQPERKAQSQREDEPGRERVTEWLLPWGPTLTVFSFVTDALGRNWRRPGERLLGLRHVDARTGGPVTVRSALIKSSVRVVTKPLQAAAVTAAQNRRKEPTRMAEPEPQVITAAGCLTPLAVTVAPHLPALLAPGHRSLSDRAAGVVVVVERRR